MSRLLGALLLVVALTVGMTVVGCGGKKTSPKTQPGTPTGVEPTEPTEKKPIEPTEKKPIEPTGKKPIEPTEKKPIEPTPKKGNGGTSSLDRPALPMARSLRTAPAYVGILPNDSRLL